MHLHHATAIIPLRNEMLIIKSSNLEVHNLFPKTTAVLIRIFVDVPALSHLVILHFIHNGIHNNTTSVIYNLGAHLNCSVELRFLRLSLKFQFRFMLAANLEETPISTCTLYLYYKVCSLLVI